ncbi:acyl-CoA dehydrogenase [Pseudomaricurvus alcaniphilus]|uniref:acyl-CoA dehydrogenase n=1 Tax=Pseudomaricurvus alcaniphilus TaxID=1166482 RepID=UPI00140799A6|nr:acyl-CoA dehydrogenase [Pseudomaricurvus alcaniphilus]NHN39810.1 acyl-CoA dehydrogenase [Pseudomaricurvus alcaniphilus]
MSHYDYPYRDVEFVINNLLNFDQLAAAGQLDGVDSGFLMEVLNEAAKLGTDVLAPLNVVGDRQGAQLTEAGVQETAGFAAAYELYQQGGWTSLAAAPEYGGQGLPNLLSTAVSEVIQTANLAFSLCPLLSTGAMHAIEAHGSDELKQTWLPKMVDGSWTGTMNLTEPDAGSDLAAVKTRAVPEGDHYRISGQKIFITWGDHQMTDNIVHLVLARLPDAPAGVKGISLFLVPKFLLDDQGQPATANDVRCVALEHKLGIHASPTCAMSFGDEGGAVGYLVGEPNEGLACMFTMMNDARQAVGLQGVAVAERSYQQARQFAKERLQGTKADGSRFSIIKFGDVRRMLLQMKSVTEAMRALAYVGAVEIDREKLAASPAEAAQHRARTELLTPIVKAWLTEMAQEVTYLGTQIHGGMGFIEETGSAQFYRDARILTIYEGTTGIQALDFVGRKVLRDGGAALRELLADIEAVVTELVDVEPLHGLGQQLGEALQTGREALDWMLGAGAENRELLQAVSVPLLMLYGHLCGGWLLGQSALRAQRLLGDGSGDREFLRAKVVSAQFFAAHLLPRVKAALDSIQRDNGVALLLSEEQFN